VDIATHPYNNSLVIFIHGVMSNQYVAWKPVIDLLQKIHKGSAPIRSYDFSSFHYDSGLLSQPSIKGYFQDLESLIARPRYDSVVLIGHSQGGVLAKLFVIDQLSNGNGQKMKIDLVITLDTPHKGPQPWIYPAVVAGGLLKLIWPLNKLAILRQTAEMSYWSRNLKKLRAQWNDAMIADTPCVPTPKKRYIRSLTVSGPSLPFLGFKLVVPKSSAEGFDIDEPIGTQRAWGLGHGVAAMLEECRPHIEEELTKNGEREYLVLKPQFLNMPASDIAIALNALKPGLGVGCEVDCWRERLKAFEIKPLRNLDQAAALTKFIDLRLQNP
jgi:pimeloyl-ACP methyl ester carboxylesterase